MLTITRTERGFTAIEMLVAMSIGLMVMSVFLMMIMQAWTRTDDADSHAIASARVTNALDRMADDLRSARKPERADIFQTATKDELRVQLEAQPVHFGDVAVATGNRLSFYTNGDGDQAVTCVTWSYQQVNDGQAGNVWALTRRMDAACAPAPTQGREVLATLPAGATPNPNTFRYGVLATPDATRTCPIVVRSPGAGALDTNQRLRIVNVHVDLSTGAARGRIAARTRGARAVIGLWSRLNDDYYFALECAS